MTTGENVGAKVWRMVNLADDRIGGANVSGTILYSHIAGRISQSKSDIKSLQQGYELNKIFTFLIRPATLDIRERDEIEITQPYNHPYLGDRFRVMSSDITSMHPSDSRGYLILYLTRSDYAHTKQ